MKNTRYTVKNFYLLCYLKFLDFVFSKMWKQKKIPEFKSYSSILVVQLAHLGDVVLSTSILPLIKEKYPNAKIGVLVGNYSKDLIKDHPLINKIHVLDHPKNSRKDNNLTMKCWKFIRQWLRVVREIKENWYEVSIDLSGYYPNSHFLTYVCDIRQRIGYSSSGGGPLLTSVFHWDNQKKHITLRYEKLLEGIGVPPTGKTYLNPSLSLGESTKKLPRDSYIIMHPFSGDIKKNWNKQNWRKLLICLLNKGYKICFTGYGEKEKKEVENIIQGIDSVTNFVGFFSLSELKSFVFYAKLVISTDTMIGHLAAAFNTSSITIFTKNSNSDIWYPPSKCSFSIKDPTLEEVLKCVDIVL